MEGRCPVTRSALTAVVIVVFWASLTSCYKLELDDAVKNDMRNLTCESYCTHCNCTGTFLEQDNKCVCSCDDQTPTDPTCLAEIEGIRDLIGLNYAIEDAEPTSANGGKEIAWPQAASITIATWSQTRKAESGWSTGTVASASRSRGGTGTSAEATRAKSFGHRVRPRTSRWWMWKVLLGAVAKRRSHS
ncbi:hypothetical protein pipiens_014012 [Culex pipiens pipiens]|uniref:Uncharacterized protein n=1 Tax=Culex pipiens pipiens TaxID=38569 RepID=A0ABD1CW83_CULPP